MSTLSVVPLSSSSSSVSASSLSLLSLVDDPELELPPCFSGHSCWHPEQQVLVIDVSPLCGCATRVYLSGWQRGMQGVIWREGELEYLDDPFQLDVFPIEFFQHRLMQGWVETIPAELLTPLQVYPSHALGILHILCQDSAAYDLFRQHATLFYLLFRHALAQGIGLPQFLAYCRLKRVEIARICGLPATPSCIKLLKKLQVSRFTQGYVEGVLELLRLNYTSLNHHRRLPESLWLNVVRYPVLLDMPVLRHWQTDTAPQLLASLQEFKRMRAFKHVALRDLLDDLRHCHTVTQVIHCQRRWEAKVFHPHYVARPLPFPPPPLPGNSHIMPITDYHALDQEGETLQHCVEGFYLAIVDGQYYAYQILAPERATLGIKIRRHATGKSSLRIDQLRGPGNQAVSIATQRAVMTWFDAASATGVTHD